MFSPEDFADVALPNSPLFPRNFTLRHPCAQMGVALPLHGLIPVLGTTANGQSAARHRCRTLTIRRARAKR